MNIDIHAHFVPPDSLKVASEIGKGQGLALAKNEAGRDVLSRDGFLPYTPYDMGDPQPVKSLGQTKIAENELELISGANACKLFGIGL